MSTFIITVVVADEFSNWMYNFELIFMGAQTHEDYRGLERAKEAMVDVANYINEMKRDSEHLELIQKVRVSICLIVMCYRRELMRIENFSLNYVTKFVHSFGYLFEHVANCWKSFLSLLYCRCCCCCSCFHIHINQIKPKPCLYFGCNEFRIEFMTWICQMEMIWNNTVTSYWMVNWALNHMRIRRQSIVTHSFSRKSWYSWKFQSLAIMACTRFLIRLTWRTIEWSHRLDGERWAVIHGIHCCCHANHSRLHSLCTWKQRLNVTNGWRLFREPCKLLKLTLTFLLRSRITLWNWF